MSSGCGCSWCENGRAEKARYVPDKGTRKLVFRKGEKPASKKVLMDRYNQARKCLLDGIQRFIRYKGKRSNSDFFGRPIGRRDWYAPQYRKARSACKAAGIQL